MLAEDRLISISPDGAIEEILYEHSISSFKRLEGALMAYGPSSVVLISEEKARISVAENGRFAHIGIDDIALRKYLNDRMFIASGD